MKTPVLMYHEIGDFESKWVVSPADFERQMNYLKEQDYKTVSFEEMGEEKKVVLTFDDARKGVLNYVYPILKKLEFKAYLFVVSDWAEGKKREGKEEYGEFLTWEEIKNMSDVFIFGGHSKSHADLTSLSPEDLDKEVVESKKIIEEKLGIELKDFAYPYGKFNSEVEKKVLEAGFENILTTVRGFGGDKKRLPRQWILNNTSFEEFKKMLRKPTISLCMIVKDEEKNLEGCLNSVQGLVDEIVVVDDGSTDETKKIASQFTNKIYDFKWCDDFAAARNESLKQATGNWILVLDADERLLESEKEKIKQLVNNWEVDGFQLITKNYSDNSSIRGWRDGWFPSLKVRLFQNGKGIKFEGAVHEMVENSIQGKVERVSVFVEHLGKSSEDKREYYLELARKKTKENPSAKAFHELGVQYKALGFFAEAAENFEKSIEMDGKERVPYLDLAVIYKEQGKFDEAIGVYEKLLQQGESGEVYFGLGVVYFRKGDFDKAAESFEKSIELNPQNIEAYNNLGAMYEKMGDLKRGKAVLLKAVEMVPKNARAHYNLGVIFEKERNLGMAVKAYENAMRLNYSREGLKEKVEGIRRYVGNGNN